MKSFKKVLITILSVLPVIYTAVTVLFFMPETVAVHFGFDGRPDRYGSKYEAFLFPGIILLMFILYKISVSIPKKGSADRNNSVIRNLDIVDTVMLSLIVVFNAINVGILLAMADPSSLGDGGLFFIILSTAMGVLFIVMGNIMPKSRRNGFVGFRLPFAMDTDEHWYIANRAGGISMVAAGLVTVIASLVFRSVVSLYCMLIAVFIALTVAILYSYVKIKGEKK